MKLLVAGLTQNYGGHTPHSIIHNNKVLGITFHYAIILY